MVKKRIEYLEYEFFDERDIEKFKKRNPKIDFIKNDKLKRWDVIYYD